MNSSWLSENLLKKQQQKSMSGGGKQTKCLVGY